MRADTAPAGLKRSLPSLLRVLILVGALAGVVIVAGLVFAYTHGGRLHWYRPYSEPATSMCPTLCRGEFFFVDILGHSKEPPQRGSIILFQHGENSTLFIKRVAGLPGDKISVNALGVVKVNGETLKIPTLCGDPPSSGPTEAEYDGIGDAVVPQGELFVVGDNSTNSNDSRYEMFGPVKFEDVRGQPVMIYLSSNKNRVGCILR